MKNIIEKSKKNRVLRRVLENTDVFSKKELSDMSAQELIHMQDILLVKLIIKRKFQNRKVNMEQLWN